MTRALLSGQRKLRHRAGSTADRLRARTHVPQSGRPVRIRHQHTKKFAPALTANIRRDDGVFCVWQAAVEDSLCAYQFDIFRAGGRCNSMRRKRLQAASTSHIAIHAGAGRLYRDQNLWRPVLCASTGRRPHLLHSTKERLTPGDTLLRAIARDAGIGFIAWHD